jgi:hypothetical protein
MFNIRKVHNRKVMYQKGSVSKRFSAIKVMSKVHNIMKETRKVHRIKEHGSESEIRNETKAPY